MNSYLQPRTFSHSHEADLTAPLRKALDQKYGQVVNAARKHWERNFAGKDPSDSCVSVRVSRNTLASSRPSFRRALAYGL
ncbi:MAG: hypothetical protein M3R10_07555 [Verrucomicrobiota bacterium]|nr:hypothetical protein [Verrucomicrobiota bacterium]